MSRVQKKRLDWKLRPHSEGHGALSELHIKELSTRFGIDYELIEQLSIKLPSAYNPQRVKRSVKRQKKVDGSERAVEAKKALRSAIKKLEKAQEAMRHVSFSDYSRGVAIISGISDALDYAFIPYKDLTIGLKEDQPHLIQRQSPDSVHRTKRACVCHAIFATWEAAGRKVTYTTNHLDSRREGPLIDFVNAVARLITNPPSALGGETIRREIEGYREQKRLIDEMSVFRAQNSRREAT